MSSNSYLAWASVLLCLATTAVPKPLSTSTSRAQAVVDLGYSQYQGTSLSSGVNQFLGMRYAAPPLGDLRFRAPADPLTTSGLQSALAVFILLLSYS
jgi:acetylcholinesterase